MTQIYHKKACCWFYKSGSSTSQAGGCTKEFLDNHNGDVSLVMSPTGQPKQNATADAVNDFDTETAQLTAVGLDTNVLAGLIARINNSFCEVVSVNPDTIGVDQWAGKTEYLWTDTNGVNSIIYPDDDSLYSVGDYVHVKGTNGQVADGTYEILSIEYGGLEIDDGMSVYDNDWGNLYAAPESLSSINIVIGGAYNDLQDVLNIPDAYYHNQWIFFNEEIAPSVLINGSAYYIYSSHDGEAANNTKLYIVGYNTYAYDCLPDGYGYFPEGTQNASTHYKTALERAKNPSDAAIKADLPTATTKNITDNWGRIFRVYTSAENVQFMCIYFEVAVYHWPILADNETTGSLFVKHCAGGHVSYDAAPAFYGGQIVRVNDAATGGGIFDSFFKGVEMFNGTTPTVDSSGDWEFAYNVGIYTSNINPDYSGPVVHHNIFVKSNWGVSSVARSYQNVFNNIFYLCRQAGLHLNGTEARMRAWNNIIVMDETSGIFNGLFRISAGGTLDYFDYNCYCNQNGQPVTVFAFDTQTNLSFNFDNLKKGPHDIEKDPLFMDPDNWDFRLRENSPCIGMGRPDMQGNPATIGPYLEKQTVGLYGKNKSLYGV
ncbi:MAG: hypothetical protein OEV87_01175 [Phycisphaerae bacterium]|nr:hypothetical protein [Phycisphaerae bacterium]